MKEKRVIKFLLIFVFSISVMTGIIGTYARESKLEPLLQIENKKLDKTLATAVKNSQELNKPENLKNVKSAMKSGVSLLDLNLMILLIAKILTLVELMRC